MALVRSRWVELFWRWHPRLYRWSGGRIGGELVGLPVLLLETTGRRTGTRRETALTYLPRGRDFVVIASVLGEPRHPGWYLNLRATPGCRVQVGRERVDCVARDAEGEEREAIWDALVARSPEYEVYRERTERRIPVVVLERAAG
ncbi:MAG: nitroreductase family deazaflavin-dependent oxidoreductase [Spirochaetaceae bacterium]|nr:nitroreductase family deazaflavin-dependent oxidoreductase [Myxococcales bacterium]MCB9725910.1 nitroreductase family deazaflavin-dependent oxidoreductase [Spirochaetaceae bacterium]HPG27204.1 nitroreductase/quinone reductase family protein [Myxococcota bacterium]